MKLRTRDYKKSWTLEEAMAECGEFGNWEIVDVECYVCEKEEPELMKWCKQVKRAGGLSEYLKGLKKGSKDRDGGSGEKKSEEVLVKPQGVNLIECVQGIDKITSKSIREVLVRVFSKVGVFVNSGELLKVLRDLLSNVITDKDKELLKDGKTERWEKIVLWELYRLRKEGKVVRDSGGYRWVG